MKVCYFGGYNPAYPRNLIIRRALERIGYQVEECRIAEGVGTIPGCFALMKKFLKINKNEVKYLFVAEFNHRFVFLAFLLSRIFRLTLIFDPFVSFYDSNVCDRKTVKKDSLKGRWYFCLDKYTMKMSDYVLADTAEHKKLYENNFKCCGGKILVIPVGADEAIYKYSEDKNDNSSDFHVLFWGTFIPLHGIDIIIRAAKILENEKDITFTLVGNGAAFDEMIELAGSLKVDNVRFEGAVKPDQLSGYMCSADICLGIFGVTEKTGRVIPNKVFSALAMGKPVITADTTAIREYLTNGYDISLVESGNPVFLAKEILVMKNDPLKRTEIGQNGLKTYYEEFSTDRISLLMKEYFERMNKN